jgi:hypothetical protein
MEIVKFNLDVAIVVIFLVINLVAGLYYAGGKTTLREYAVGDKKFSTSTLRYRFRHNHLCKFRNHY